MTFNLDQSIENADWIKTRTWDIWTPGYTKLVDTIEELALSIAPMTVEHFLTLPAAKAMPAKLRDELSEAQLTEHIFPAPSTHGPDDQASHGRKGAGGATGATKGAKTATGASGVVTGDVQTRTMMDLTLTDTAYEEAIAYAVANNKGRKNADGTRSAPWTRAQIEAGIAEAEIAAQQATTIEVHDNTPARQEMRKGWLKEAYTSAPTPEGARPVAYFYLGPPGAGKSTQQREDEALMGAKLLLIDPDEFKKKMPEYANGLGAYVTHEESSMLAGELLATAKTNRQNVAIATVGDNYGKLANKIQAMRDAGYDVHVRLVNITPQNVLNRTLTRFVEHGRYVDPKYAYESVDSKPEANFIQLTKDNRVTLSSADAFDNNGDKPVRYHPKGN